MMVLGKCKMGCIGVEAGIKNQKIEKSTTLHQSPSCLVCASLVMLEKIVLHY